jgi:OOP family OmpA-OmpF porin
MRTHVLLVISALLLLSACDSAHSLRELRNASFTGDAYQQALAAAYRDYALEKEQRYEWEASRYFADKGLLAAYGNEIAPEDPAQWHITEDQQALLNDARRNLVAALEANRSTQAEMSASAVLAYDRWLEFEHYGWNETAIQEQRHIFEAILSKLEEAHAASAETVPTTTIPKQTTSTVLYFPMNRDTMGDSALAALDELVRYVSSAGNVTINVNGHADRVGSEDYNMDLSQRRARFVVKALIAAGIAESAIGEFAFGETDPAIATEDGIAEPRNRRVEIYLE